MRGVQSIDQRLAFRETLRALVTSLPERRDLDAGTATGVAAGFRWRLDIVPFVATFVDPQSPSPWQPEAVVITVRSPSGQELQINTIRLRRKQGRQ
jgi:general secretion pathway protein I